MSERIIYLDHAATTPMRREAIDAMTPYFDEQYANPSGAHRFARDARRVLDEARDEVAAVLGCRAGEVVFTGGGTEGDNAAILGAIRYFERHGVAARAVCCAAEHHAVLHCVEHVGGIVVSADEFGNIKLDELTEVLTSLTEENVVPVVSVMAVNNETGTIASMAEVARIVRRYAPKALLHTDAVQAACWLNLAELASLVDVLTLSSHKFAGPKGVGVMYVRQGVTLEPLILGGGQERDRRSGTHNVAGIVATAAALTATAGEREAEWSRVAALKTRLLAGLEATPTIPVERAVPGIVHVCVEGVENEALLFLLDEKNLCASAASACASGAMEPSHVLAAMGVPVSRAKGALRLSLGHTTTSSDIDEAIRIVNSSASRLRNHRPS